MKCVFKTDVGKLRKVNEDQALVKKNEAGDILLLVLDGMGGHQYGKLASSKAAEFISKKFEKKKIFKNSLVAYRWLKNTIKKANQLINKMGEENPLYHDMGTTIVAGLIVKDKLVMANVGDSRIYGIKENITQLSDDETYVQFLYKTGKITKEDMKTHPKKHVLTNALGTYPCMTIQMKVFDLDFDYLLLCSDGLYNEVSEEKILKVLKESVPLEEKCERLILLANKCGGKDNITVVLWEAN